MNKCLMKAVAALIVGAFIFYVWEFASWMVLPWHAKTMKSFENPTIISELILNEVTERGTYVLPHPESGPDASGPYLYAGVNPDLNFEVGAAQFAKSFFVNLIAMLLGILLLCMSQINCYKKRLMFFTLVGLTSGWVCHVPKYLWFHHGCGHVMVMIFEVTIGFFLAGLVVSALLPKKEACGSASVS